MNSSDAPPPPRDRATRSGSRIVDLLEELHRSRPPYLDEDLAPEVDFEVLRRLVRRELSSECGRLVYRLIVSFKSWDDAHTQIIVEEFHRRRNEHSSLG